MGNYKISEPGWAGLAAAPWVPTLPSTSPGTQAAPTRRPTSPTAPALSPARWPRSRSPQQPPSSRSAGFSFQRVSLRLLGEPPWPQEPVLLPGRLPGAGALPSVGGCLKGPPAARGGGQPSLLQRHTFPLGPEGRCVPRKGDLCGAPQTCSGSSCQVGPRRAEQAGLRAPPQAALEGSAPEAS